MTPSDKAFNVETFKIMKKIVNKVTVKSLWASSICSGYTCSVNYIFAIDSERRIIASSYLTVIGILCFFLPYILSCLAFCLSLTYISLSIFADYYKYKRNWVENIPQ